MTEHPDQPLEEEVPDDQAIGQALRWSGIVVVGVALIAGIVTLLMPRAKQKVATEAAPVVVPESREAPKIGPPAFNFVDITTEAGITFVHNNSLTENKLLPETMGGGCAFFDYDNDGDQDLLFVDSNRWPIEPAKPESPSLRLYLNDGNGNFTDFTQEAGITTSCYGMGVAVGDYDNDGDIDIFISAVGTNVLLRNDEGIYTDVTAAVGVAGSEEAWSTSVGFFDYDNDGDLDLFVGNYVKWSPEIDLIQDFRLTGVGRAYGPPFSFGGSFPYLYRNDGDAGFTEVSEAAGLHIKTSSSDAALTKTLGVRPYDVNSDGWVDLLIANDTVQNLLFLNNQDGTFREAGAEAGVAFDSNGKARGAMGIDVARFRESGDLGIAIGNFANEMIAFYVSTDNGQIFTDDAIPTSLGPLTRSDLTFGLFFFDADLDGRLDLFSANGHIENEINRVQSGQHYQQASQLFWNAGSLASDEFLRVSNAGDMAHPMVGRGAIYADIDADGDLDVLVTQIGGPPILLRNELPTDSHYLRLQLVGTRCNRDAIGAKVTVVVAGKKHERCVGPTRSYLSQVELPLTIGLGNQTQVESVVVRWPDGSEQRVTDIKIDGLTVVQQE